jgi:hypothetical protein
MDIADPAQDTSAGMDIADPASGLRKTRQREWTFVVLQKHYYVWEGTFVILQKIRQREWTSVMIPKMEIVHAGAGNARQQTATNHPLVAGAAGGVGKRRRCREADAAGGAITRSRAGYVNPGAANASSAGGEN